MRMLPAPLAHLLPAGAAASAGRGGVSLGRPALPCPPCGTQPGVSAAALPPCALQASQHAACRLRVTVRRRTRSGGHKFKLAGVMVLPPGTHEFSSNDRLDVVVPQLFEKV